MDIRGLLALTFTMAVWGISPVFFRSLTLALGPGDQLVIRYAMVGIVFLVILLATGGWRLKAADWPRMLFLGLGAYVCYNLGSAFGFVHINAGTGSLIIGTQPLLIAVVGILLAREPLTATTVVGLAVGFIGILFLVWKDLGVSGEPQGFLLGCAMIFVSGGFWALYAVISRPLSQRYGSLTVTAMSSVLCAAALVLLLGRPSTLTTLAGMDSAAWTGMFYLVVLVNVITMVTWNYGAARLPAAAAGAFLYLVPPIGVLAGALILGEKVTSGMVIGGALIMAGVAITQFGPMLKARRA